MLTRTPLSRRAGILLTGLAVSLSLSLAACSSDTTTTDEPGATSIPDPARGAADGVTDLSEDGQKLDDGNPEGTERDTEIDQAERND